MESETGVERLEWQSGKVVKSDGEAVKSGEGCRLCEGFWNLRLMRRVGESSGELESLGRQERV